MDIKMIDYIMGSGYRVWMKNSDSEFFTESNDEIQNFCYKANITPLYENGIEVGWVATSR